MYYFNKENKMERVSNLIIPDELTSEEEDRILEVQFDIDGIFFSVEWNILDDGGLAGIRAESVFMNRKQAVCLAKNILEWEATHP